MTDGATAEVALLADHGSAWTKLTLVGRSSGRWRVAGHVAGPSAWGFDELRRTLVTRVEPHADARLAGAIESLIEAAPRIECHSPPRAARLGLVAVSRELSGAAARRAAEAAGWAIVASASLDDGQRLDDRIAAVRAADVDAWLVAGGFDAGHSPLALEAASLVATVRRADDTPVVWAGATSLAGEVDELFGSAVVQHVPNPRPDARGEDGAALRAHLEDLLHRTIQPYDGGHLAPIALRRSIAELARASGLSIVGVDVGARYATRAAASRDGAVSSRVLAAGGLGAAHLAAGAGRIARAMSEPIDEAAVGDLLADLHAHPNGLPATEDELAVAQAAARAQLAALVEDAPIAGVDLVIGMGRVLAAAPRPSDALLMLLDGLRPVGVTQLAVDTAGVLGPLGALPDDEIGEGIALLGEDLFTSLGTAVVCRGGAAGEPAMRVTLRRAGWPDIGPLEVRGGQLLMVPLAAGTDAELVIEPGDGVSLGAARRSSRIVASATGGALGLVLDARDVPTALPRRTEDRRTVLAGWRAALEREPPPIPERSR